MVRETRHLWVRNLPDNIREERIRDHFKRYGRVQSVKIFARKGVGECDNGLVGCGSTGICATVSFMDIKSASKAHLSDHKLDDHGLTTEYHEPAPIPSSPATPAVPSTVSAGGSPVTPAAPSTLRHPPPYSSPRISYGPEDITTFDTRSSHFFERRDGTDTYVRRPPSAYVVSPSESLRGRTRERDRLYRNGPTHYTPILESVVARTPPTHHRSVTTGTWSSFENPNCSRYPTVVPTPVEILSYAEDRRESPVIIVHKKHPKSRRKCRVMRRCGSNGSESVSNNSDSSRSRSHSSSSSSHSRSSSSSSDSSSAAISERSCSTHSHHGSLKSAVTVHSAVSTPPTNCSPVVHTDDRRPLAVCVRNLPARPGDNTLKDSLFHEFKKYGKVTFVKISGQGASRSAIVCFKKADDAEKALQLSHDKVFFGTKTEVTVYQGFDVDDNELRPGEPDMDEYHPKATRTLFIGNLEKDVSLTDLRNTFSKFGEIIDIDIKKQGPTCYAFCQYCDISSVVKAMHAMDGEYLGNNKINLGYGKSHATNCLWVAGVADCVTEKQLIGSFSQFGLVTHVHINRSQGKALVFFQQVTHAQAALTQMRGYVLKNRRLMTDFASSECQENFYEGYEKSKSSVSSCETNCQDSPRSTSSTRGLDTPVSTASTNSGHVCKHSANSTNCTSNSGSNNGSVNNCSKVHSRLQHTTSSLRTTPTRQLVQQTPSSSCASPIVNNTPSPSPSTSSRSTPHPQHTSRFDYNNTLECSSDKRLSRSLEELNLNVDNGDKPPPTPHEDITLQKERVSLLEQLNDYSSSEDEEEELVSMKQQNTSRQRSTSCEESRPGTPLCDEKPENILAHYESRRAAKEKNASNTPLSLPLPSFANKVVRSTSPSERSSKSPHQSKPPSRPFESSRIPPSNHMRPLPSQHAKDKSNILDMKLSNITSFDTLTETLKAPWIEQLKSLDEKYEKWSGSRSKALVGKLDTSTVHVKHKLLDVNAIGRQRSEICESVLSRKSVFDDHFKRLETISDQQPSSEFIPPRPTINNTPRSHSIMTSINPLPNLGSKPSTTNNISSSVMKGLQYPFPSHPPVKPAPPLSKLSIPYTSSSSSTSSLSSVSSFSSKPSQTPDLLHLPSMTAVALMYGGCSQRTSFLLRNNSVEKLTDLPKNTSSVTAGRDPLSVHEVKKEIITSPVSSRRNSVENVDKKSVDDELLFVKKEEIRKTCDMKPMVNHIDAGKNQCDGILGSCKTNVEKDNFVSDETKCSVSSPTCSRRNSIESVDRKSVEDESERKRDEESRKICDVKPLLNHIDTEKNPCNSILSSSCKISNAENENSVLDKRKCSFDKAECKNNVVSVILHTSQKEKLCKSTEDLSELVKVSASNRRSSVESSSPKDDRLNMDRQEDGKFPDEKKSCELVNHQNKTKGSSSKADVSKPHHHKSQDNISSKMLKSKRKSEEEKPKHESHSRLTESKRELTSKLKETDREKKKEKLANSHPENGKIKNKHHSDGISKLLNRKDLSKERKNSSGSSSLSDSVHSKSKHSSFDSLESNSDEKVKSDVTMNIESHSKKLNQLRLHSCAESHSFKEDKKNSDLSRSKKSERSSNQTNPSTSPGASARTNISNNNTKKSKKSKKRKSLSDSSSDSEFESFDENKLNKKNHSIFDVVLDEPAYISMYDKVKARSTKNLQKQEEEKRQEKLKEKFNLFKQSRVKREEKKRSTSYEDDSDAERTVSRKSNKVIVDTSDEEHSGNDKLKVPVPSDSSDGERLSKDKVSSDIEEDVKNGLKKSSHRLHLSKTKEKAKPSLTDTSEDEIKLKEKKEKQKAFIKEAKRKFKKSMSKKSFNCLSSRHPSDPKRTESDFSDDIINEKDKSKSYSETARIVTGKMYYDISDEEVKSKSNIFLAKNKGNDHSNAERKFKTKPKNNLREMIAKGELNKMEVTPLEHLNKARLLSDVSEEEIMRPCREVQPKPEIIPDSIDESRFTLEKILSESSENEGIGKVPFPKVKKCNIYSDESDIDVRIKQETKDDELFYNLAELHQSYPKSDNSPPPLINPMVCDGDVDFMKKKSHKKKQKRQKSTEHSLERNKKHSKKERRKSVVSDLGDDDCKEKDHKVKQKKKKKKNRDKVKSMESLEEDIFGSMSDNSDKVLNDPRKLSKLSVSDVYDADSDSSNKDVRESSSKAVNKAINSETTSNLPVMEDNNSLDNFFDHMKTKKKKRKKSKEEKTKHHHHHHNHNRHYSKQESKRDVPIVLPDTSSPPPPSLSLPTLDDVITKSPSLCKLESVPNINEASTVSSAEAIDIVTSSIVEEKVHDEKMKVNEDNHMEVKNDNEEMVHQRAVQSISNGSAHDRAVLSISNTIGDTSVESVADSADEKTKETITVEDKTGITISQEETLVAVSTILLGDSFNNCYADKSIPQDIKSELPPNEGDDNVEDSCHPLTPPVEKTAVPINNDIELAPEEILQSSVNDESDSESVFTTPCGQNPELDKTNQTLDKSNYDSALDTTVTELVTKVDDSQEGSLDTVLSSNESGDSVDENSPVLEPPHISPHVKVSNADRAEDVKVEADNVTGESSEAKSPSKMILGHEPSHTLEMPLCHIATNLKKADITRSHTLPNNIAQKCKAKTPDSIRSPKMVTSVNTIDIKCEPSSEDAKCNGPSSLSVPELEIIQSKNDDTDSSTKLNDDLTKNLPELRESCSDEEVLKISEKVESEFRAITPKLESFDHDGLPPLSLEKSEKLPDRKIEVEAALKQKLPIPAQQNTEMTEQLTLDLEHDSCEVNEANKENIVKTIKNQENLTELTDDTKLSTFLRNRERDVKDIPRNIENEVFRSNDFSRYNHKTTESNQNNIERVVQRIRESKCIADKSEETSIAVDDRTADRPILSADEEMNNTKMLLNMSESSIIQNSTNYNCPVKPKPNRDASSLVNPECKLNDVDSSVETKKTESVVSEDPELDDETLQDLDDSKLSDHSYNAKRGRRRRATPSTGVVTRRGKNNLLPKDTEVGVNLKTKKSSTDVYEFKEDSEDEVKRPRLILTIKNPVEPTHSTSTVASEASVITECKTIVSNLSPTSVNTTNTAKICANTRKSRRLQEKDGIRSAVDDTIDEVVKTVQSPRPTRRTTRIAAAAAAAMIVTTVQESNRKSSRALKKPVTGRSNTTSSLNVDNVAPAEDDEDEFPSSPTTSIPPSASPSVPMPCSPLSVKIEPTTLIDPVSGLLIPMKEAEEGQYIPVRSDLIPSQKLLEYPPEKKLRLDETVEEQAAISLVKAESTVSRSTTEASQTTSVIASVLTTAPVIKCVPATVSPSPPNQPLKVIEPTPIPLIRDPLPTSALPVPVAVPAIPIEKVPVENGPISLIKTTTASIIATAPIKAQVSRAAAVTQPFPTAAHLQPPVVTKLHPSKSAIPQPRILTPITPKALILQAHGTDNDSHSSDEVPYPSQYNSPLIHAAVASPPLTSPKISPQPATATSARANHSIKNMVPLEPLKIEQSGGFYYRQSTSPQSRPSPQPRVIHNTPTMQSGLLSHSAVQSAHYMHPQFVYQPFMQESSITPYHQLPASAGAKIIPERGEIVEVRPPAAVAATASPPPLEFRKKSSSAAHSHLNDTPLITSPYVQSNRAFFYDEPHRTPPSSRIRLVSTPPYTGKVSLPVDSVDIYHSTPSRLYETSTGARYPSHLDHEDDDSGNNERLPGRRSYPDSNYPGARSISLEERAPHRDGELDYSRRPEIALCDSARPCSRDSSPSQMNSPPLGDSPPQGNLDGTVLVQLYPIIWQGLLALKNDQAAVQMHVVSGNSSVAYDALPKLQDGYQPLLRIAQRMRLEQAQLDGVYRKMEINDEHCTILGLPCGKNQEDVVQQATNLESCIIPYLQSKKAAGIINTAAPGTQQAAFVVHVFPPCEFADKVLLGSAPELYRKVQETAYLVCIIVTV